MKRPPWWVYALVSYTVGLASFFYFSCWLLNLVFARTVDSGPVGDPWRAFGINTLVMLVFCGGHSYFARTRVKKQLHQWLPIELERATYCLVFSLALIAMGLAWQPLPELVWQISSPGVQNAVYGVFVLLWVLHFVSIFWINHNEFFGLRQARLGALGKPLTALPKMPEPAYTQSHLLLVGSMILIPWASPTMSVGHLYFCLFITVYDVLGALWSNADHGDD